MKTRVFFYTVFVGAAIAGILALSNYNALQAQQAGTFQPKIYRSEGGNKMVVDSGGTIDVLSGGVIASAGTPIAVERVKQEYLVNSPTLAATPVAGTNMFKLGLNVIPTHAADTAGLLPTPQAAGEVVRIASAASNTVRIKPGGTNTINGGSAGAYLPIATGGVTVCTATTATAWSCNPDVQPTPQGP